MIYFEKLLKNRNMVFAEIGTHLYVTQGFRLIEPAGILKSKKEFIFRHKDVWKIKGNNFNRVELENIYTKEKYKLYYEDFCTTLLSKYFAILLENELEKIGGMG
jgi:predicted polyphosphate/ATP-dependent NAD kinase